ncbi:MAG: outer membrane lipid asymmetry maintenance protein MlaD [Chthoniobacterales bacterium]|nr:outer membrane lipid asymmetry maintenance protein MlaD [Chthoniobacterales bacterium]
MIKERYVEFFLGIFVLLGICAIGYLAIRLGAGSFVNHGSYLLEARFANVGGLNEGGSVLLAGVTVGRVEKIKIDPSDYSAIVSMRILDDVRLPRDTMASIKTSGLIGDKFVALLPGAEEDFLQPGERIVMTESAVDLESLIGKMAFGTVQADRNSANLENEKDPALSDEKKANGWDKELLNMERGSRVNVSGNVHSTDEFIAAPTPPVRGEFNTSEPGQVSQINDSTIQESENKEDREVEVNNFQKSGELLYNSTQQ